MTPAPIAVAEGTVALVGTPNCGKTTLFNALTGLRQKTANYPGVTVEKKEGLVQGADHDLRLVDLPGIYSLDAHTPEEKVARDILAGERHYARRPSALLAVLDGSALERSMGLLASLLPLGLPTAVVVTMADEIKARGGRLDARSLSKELGVPVAAIVGHRGVGIDDVRRMLASWDAWPAPKAVPAEDAAARYAWASGVLERAHFTPPAANALTRRIDGVVLHPVAGPLVFLAVMAAFFQSIFSWAQPLMELLSAGFAWLGETAGAALPEGLLRGFVVNGVIDGVGGVAVFLPQIMILFFLVFLLEDVGYMARAAFLMDRIMGWAGLQGRSFVSLMSSYACAVPGIMATRTIPSPNDRLATILVSPFMTCSARLPVYALLIGAFIPDRPFLGPLRLQGAVLLALYLAGAASAFLAAWLFRRTLLQGDITPFYMELPPYRFPTLRSVGLAMWARVKIFVRRVGVIILPVSVALWALLAFPRAQAVPGATPAEQASVQLEQSAAGRLGRALEPVFSPLGFDWRVNIGLIASLAAREVVVSALAQIYAVEQAEGDAPLKAALASGRDAAGKPFMTLPSALALLAFFVYALQCTSTLAVMQRETGGWRWPAFAFLYMFACAWAAAWAVHRLALGAGL